MIDHLRDKLQSALGSACLLERELGGGGMSRVFLAEDASLGRRIVVKVLAPELAEGLSSERFMRETRLAARLQHPNVVPVLAAGTVPGGLPYYLMPFIDGHSLRERLASGPLPVSEALVVLRDMLRALAERAAALDPGHAPAHFLLAEIAFHFEWDWAKAEPIYRRAMEAQPNDVEAPASYSLYLASVRRVEEALRVCERALALDPLNPTVLIRAMICPYLARRYEQALVSCDRGMTLFPDFPESYRWAGKALVAMGRADEAIARLETAVHLSGRHLWSVTDLGLALLAAGRVDEARRLGDELRTRAEAEPLPAFARILAPLCRTPPDLDGVFRELEAWVDERGAGTISSRRTITTPSPSPSTRAGCSPGRRTTSTAITSSPSRSASPTTISPSCASVACPTCSRARATSIWPVRWRGSGRASACER